MGICQTKTPTETKNSDGKTEKCVSILEAGKNILRKLVEIKKSKNAPCLNLDHSKLYLRRKVIKLRASPTSTSSLLNNQPTVSSPTTIN